ncbi:hypothetical protein BH23PLA1_BH23PLA1_01140 [soil metagenome]
MKRPTLPIVWALLLGPALALPTSAEDDARALLDEVIRAYQDLSAYADNGQYRLSMTINGTPFEQSSTVRLAYARPGRIDLASGPLRLLSDGETLTTIVEPLKQYAQGPAPESIRVETFIDQPVGAFLFGGPLGPPLPLLLQLLFGNDPAGAILEGSSALTLDEDREIDGRDHKALRVERTSDPDLVLLIDPDSHLVRQVEHAIDPEALNEFTPPGSTLAEAKIFWNSGEVSTDDPAEDTFAFTPPEGYTEVEALAAALGEEADPQAGRDEANHKLVGQPAPEFTITVLDGDGTAQINKLDLDGKVVLIDFWATWCGPCMQELPEIIKLIDSYEQKGEDNLVVLAVSLDSRPNDLAGVRKLVEQTLDERKFHLQREAISKVGLDPKGALSDAFQVRGIPTVVLLDREGVVRMVHVGFDPKVDLPELFAEKIDALLDDQDED